MCRSLRLDNGQSSRSPCKTSTASPRVTPRTSNAGSYPWAILCSKWNGSETKCLSRQVSRKLGQDCLVCATSALVYVRLTFAAICSGSRITKVHDFGYVSLDIAHVRDEDEGVYMCRASNPLGEAVTTASMKIKSEFPDSSFIDTALTH